MWEELRGSLCTVGKEKTGSERKRKKTVWPDPRTNKKKGG